MDKKTDGMKLKTVKDLFWLEELNCCGCGACDEGMGCDIKKIKQEAIKWIKDFRSRTEIRGILNIPEAEICFENTERDVRSNLAKIRVLKKFFNITEEDLK